MSVPDTEVKTSDDVVHKCPPIYISSGITILLCAYYEYFDEGIEMGYCRQVYNEAGKLYVCKYPSSEKYCTWCTGRRTGVPVEGDDGRKYRKHVLMHEKQNESSLILYCYEILVPQ